MRQRVIVVAGKDPAGSHGGSETYIRAFGRAALQAGYEPHIFCVSDRTETIATDFGTLDRNWSPVRPFRGLMNRLHQPFLLAGIDRFARDHQGPYLVHSFGPWGGVALAAVRRLKRRHRCVLLSTPFSTYYHETAGKVLGMGEHYPLGVRLQHRLELWWTAIAVAPGERRGFHAADEVLPNYDSVRAIVEAECGSGIRFGRMKYASESAFLHPPGQRSPPLPEVLAALEPRAAPLIMSVSRHDARKGLNVFLQALAELQRRGTAFRACLIGGGALLGQHRELARTLGIGENVLIAGPVDSAFDHLSHADIFVLPSLEEGSGSVSLLEAMQAGAVAVLSRLDGLPEDVEHEDSALFVEPGNSLALADALHRCLVDPALRTRLSAAAFARYKRDFSADSFAADIGRIYAAHGF